MPWVQHWENGSEQSIEVDEFPKECPHCGHSVVRSFIEAENKERPFANLPEKEGALLCLLAKDIEKESYAGRTLEGLADSIYMTRRTYNRSIKANKIALWLGVVTLIATLGIAVYDKFSDNASAPEEGGEVVSPVASNEPR